MSKKGFNNEPPRPKAINQLVQAFLDTYQPIEHEDMADDLFTMRRLREYFSAYLMPKMPDPLPPYLDELDKHGFRMRTTYEGTPAIFVINVRGLGERIYAEEITDEDEKNGEGDEQKRIGFVSYREEDDEEDEDDEDDFIEPWIDGADDEE